MVRAVGATSANLFDGASNIPVMVLTLRSILANDLVRSSLVSEGVEDLM